MKHSITNEVCQAMNTKQSFEMWQVVYILCIFHIVFFTYVVAVKRKYEALRRQWKEEIKEITHSWFKRKLKLNTIDNIKEE